MVLNQNDEEEVYIIFPAKKKATCVDNNRPNPKNIDILISYLQYISILVTSNNITIGCQTGTGRTLPMAAINERFLKAGSIL